MRKLIAGLVAVLVVYILFYLHPQTPPPALDWRDDVWVSLITGTSILAALVMLLPRLPWTWRAVGLFLTSLATAALYAGVLWTRHDSNPTPGIPETWADVIRALYVVGGPLLLYGLLVWLGDRWRERRGTPYPPDARDRSGVGLVGQDVGMSDNVRRSVRCAAQVLVAGFVYKALGPLGDYASPGWEGIALLALASGISNMVWNTGEDAIGMRFLGPLDHRLGDAVIAAETTHTTVHKESP